MDNTEAVQDAETIVDSVPETASTRPQLQRNQSAPTAPAQPPPPVPPPPPNTDSLSLAQLKRIVDEFPQAATASYTFHYADSTSLEDELDEWFCYSKTEYARLHKVRDAFRNQWGGVDVEWQEASDDVRAEHMKRDIRMLQDPDPYLQRESLRSILHVVAGVWDETAEVVLLDEPSPLPGKTRASASQLEHMQQGIRLLVDCGGLPIVYGVLQTVFERLWLVHLASMVERILIRVAMKDLAMFHPLRTMMPLRMPQPYSTWCWKA